ncbi:uncharacterized protein PHACADRAFT_264941 [Phanerochaete carnosa HHB-10118-sp]|uniref:Uncharacterized protein n=1 Tax=Phanerochaete carnosa (strain HHB-10118-sp) TaxID=650164 RepID=K5VUU6_PHACS|nr:uncharacterized protein PHACADRAFT_264941 [Phanerochaete carnosa HHB-10118-sp]EKM50329.1 hypothetical protein PHACADRAFT_264941 [Phanerochaete carnosa HHB-10118-sp]
MRHAVWGGTCTLRAAAGILPDESQRNGVAAVLRVQGRGGTLLDMSSSPKTTTFSCTFTFASCAQAGARLTGNT